LKQSAAGQITRPDLGIVAVNDGWRPSLAKPQASCGTVSPILVALPRDGAQPRSPRAVVKTIRTSSSQQTLLQAAHHHLAWKLNTDEYKLAYRASP